MTGTITITLLEMPNDGGSPILDTHYALDGGSLQSMGLTAIGEFIIPNLVENQQYAVSVYAENSIGVSLISDIKQTVPIPDSPVISNLVVAGNGDISFDTDTGAGTAYYLFGDNANPTADDIINGVGDLNGSFPVTASGGQSGSVDLSSIAGETKYCSVVHVSGDPSNVLTEQVTVDSGAYTQNRVNSNGTAWLRSTGGHGTPTQLTYATTYEANSIGFGFMFSNRSTNGMQVQFINGGQMRVRLWDSAGTEVYNGLSDNVIQSTTEDKTIVVQVDWSVAASESVTVTVNGSVEPMTASIGPLTGTGLIRMTDAFIFCALNNNASPAPGKYADTFFDVGTIHAANLFHDGANPLDISAIGVGANYWFGGDMTADERNGDANEGWNDFFNQGTAGMNTGSGSGTFTDV